MLAFALAALWQLDLTRSLFEFEFFARSIAGLVSPRLRDALEAVAAARKQSAGKQADASSTSKENHGGVRVNCRPRSNKGLAPRRLNVQSSPPACAREPHARGSQTPPSPSGELSQTGRAGDATLTGLGETSADALGTSWASPSFSLPASTKTTKSNATATIAATLKVLRGEYLVGE